MCVWGGGLGRLRRDRYERLAGEKWIEGAPGWVVPMGQLRGRFLQRWTPGPRAPPPFPFNSVATWGLLWWQLWSWWLWDYSSSVTLTTSHEVRRGKGREGGRRWSWKKGEEGEGRGGEAALRHFCRIPRLFWSLCKVEIWLQPLHREGKKPFKWKISCLSRSST